MIMAIMNAKGWISGKKSIEQLINIVEGDFTVVVLDQDGVKKFVIGSFGSYGKVGSKHHIRNNRGAFVAIGTIENEVIVKDGKMTSINDIGLNEKRAISVFK